MKLPFQIRNNSLILLNCLEISITSLFQLQFSHCLKRWTPKFLSFKMICNFLKNNLKNLFKNHVKFKICVVAKFEFQFPILNFKLWSLTFFFLCFFFVSLHNFHFLSFLLCIVSFAFLVALIMLENFWSPLYTH